MPGTGAGSKHTQEAGQHGAVPPADPPTAAGAGTPQLCRGAVEVLEGLDGSSRYATRGASSLLRRPRQARYPSATATASRRFSGCAHRGEPTDERWKRTWLRWSQVRNPRRINRTAPMVKSPPHHPQPSPRASRPSCSGSDGGGPESPAQGHVPAGHRTGVGGPPSGVIWRPGPRMVPNPSTSDTMAAPDKNLAEVPGRIAKRWRRETDLRDERGGSFDAGDCSGVGARTEYGVAVSEVTGGDTAQAAIPTRVEVGSLHRAH